MLNADIILPDSSTHAQRIKREAHEVGKGKGERMPPGCSSLLLQIPVVLYAEGENNQRVQDKKLNFSSIVTSLYSSMMPVFEVQRL